MRSAIILCSTRRSHYAIENHIRYELSPSLLLKLKEYIKTTKKREDSMVSKWVANLPEHTQKLVRVFPYHRQVA